VKIKYKEAPKSIYVISYNLVVHHFEWQIQFYRE